MDGAPVFCNAEKLSLWESWREAPERARMPQKNKKSDGIALTKANAHRCVDNS